MTDDATLSDFGVDADSRTDVDDTDDGDDEDSSDDREPPEDGVDESAADGSLADESETDHGGGDRPNPTLSTYAWGNYTCSQCGAETERVWRDGDAFVCPDCKEW